MYMYMPEDMRHGIADSYERPSVGYLGSVLVFESTLRIRKSIKLL